MSGLTFNKKAISTEEQLNLLISRGLIINDRRSAVELLKSIGYYRLSSYMRNFQEGQEHLFKGNAEFKDIIDLYFFDMELRSICLIALEKIEIAYRAAITNIMCTKFDSHWFYNKEAFKDHISIENDILPCIKDSIQKKKNNPDEYAETFIKKYYENYSSPALPPFWMVVETFTIGTLNWLFHNLKRQHKKEIVEYIGFKEKDKLFVTDADWLFPLCVTRNICAHHSRLYNRIFKITPRKYREIKEFDVPTNTFYYIAQIINLYLTNISYDISFNDNLINLFNKYPQIKKAELGFPNDWHGFTITYIEKKYPLPHKA